MKDTDKAFIIVLDGVLVVSMFWFFNSLKHYTMLFYHEPYLNSALTAGNLFLTVYFTKQLVKEDFLK